MKSHLLDFADSRPIPGTRARRGASGLLGMRQRPQLDAKPRLSQEVGASVARCPRTPPDAAKTPGLQIGISSRITQLEQPEHSCRWQLWIGPVTAVPCRAKARPLRPRRSYFAPARSQRELVSGLRWRRRVLPPGPKGLLRRPFIAISGLRRHPSYRPRRLTNKDPVGPARSIATAAVAGGADKALVRGA